MNKHICQRCRKNVSWWNDFDDDRWEEGKIICVIDGDMKPVDTLVVPDWCNYELEHVMANDKKIR